MAKWNDFFYFSRRERQGILLLLVLIAGIFLGRCVFSPKKEQAIEIQEYTEEKAAAFDESPQEAYTPLFQKENPKKTDYPPSKKEEKRTYYVQQRERDTLIRAMQNQHPKTEKWAEGTVIELNTADSLDLKKIPGIGSSFAKRIIAYRALLGGYHRIEQLQEIYGMYEELYEKITPYLKIDPSEITQIPVNTSSLDKLKAHPYINFYQAKAIIELRKKKGKLESTGDLKLLDEFTNEDWIRLTPYLGF